MRLSCFLLCSICRADDPVDTSGDTAQQVIQQVDYMADRVTDIGAKLDAIERMLSDQEKVELGLSPPGWTPPDFETYLMPNSPQSFVPVVVPVPVVVTLPQGVRVFGPQP